MRCGINLYKLLNYKSNDKNLTIVYSIFIIKKTTEELAATLVDWLDGNDIKNIIYKNNAKKVFRKGRCDMVPVIDNIETGNNIRRIMQNQGLTVKDVKKYLGLGCLQSIYRWMNGANVPSIDNLYALSNLFQMPIDEIVRGNRPKIEPRDEHYYSMRKRMLAYCRLSKKYLSYD